MSSEELAPKREDLCEMGVLHHFGLGNGVGGWSARLVEGVSRLSELQGGKFKLKAPRIGKVIRFGVGAVEAGQGKAKEAEELLSKLWALSGLGGGEGGRGVRAGGRGLSGSREGGGWGAARAVERGVGRSGLGEEWGELQVERPRQAAAEEELEYAAQVWRDSPWRRLTSAPAAARTAPGRTR